MSHDPVSGIQRWDIFYDPVYCDQIMKEAGRGRFIKVSDLPALIARIRADDLATLNYIAIQNGCDPNE